MIDNPNGRILVKIMKDIYIPEFTLLGNKVLVKRDTPDTTKGGIILPESALTKPQYGTILLTGPGNPEDPVEVKPGDRVMLPHYGGLEVELDGETYLIVGSGDILGIMQDDELQPEAQYPNQQKIGGVDWGAGENSPVQQMSDEEAAAMRPDYIPAPRVKLAPHMERMIVEKSELDAKITKLNDFITNNSLLRQCSEAEQLRLKRQLLAMLGYSNILSDRITAFPTPG